MTRNTPSNAIAVVNDLASKTGVTLTESGRDILALIAQSELEWDTGEIAGRDASGTSIPAADWLTAKLAGNPNWTATTETTTTTPPPVDETMTARGLRLNAERRRGGAKTAAAEKLVTDFGNPFQPGRTFNRARAGFVANHAPELADRLRAEAAL